MNHFEGTNGYIYIVMYAVIAGIVLGSGILLFTLSTSRYTRLSQKYITPTRIEQQDQPIGPVPNQPPQIGRVYPWVGKIGDVVWVQGFHFGNNPEKKSLSIGGVAVSPSDIMGWYDEVIQAKIPQGAEQGGRVSLQVGDYPLSVSLPIVIYDAKTPIRLKKEGTQISVLSGVGINRLSMWVGDETMPTVQKTVSRSLTSTALTPLIDTEGKPILSIILYDGEGNPLPYIADPIEFGF